MILNNTIEFMFTHRLRRHERIRSKDITRLIDMEDGQTGIIKSILGGRMSVKRLADLGLNSGKEIKVLRKTLFSGPVQIELSGSRLVLGRGLASKIIVEMR